MKLSLLLVLSTLPFVMGCPTERSTNVPQTWVGTDYELLFDATDHTVIAKAQFTSWSKDSDGWSTKTYIELTDQAAIFFDNQSMTLVEPLYKQLFYRKILSRQDFEKEHQWRYVQNDGTQLINTARAIEIPNFVLATTEISKNGFTFSWNTNLPIGNDKLILKYYGFKEQFEDSRSIEEHSLQSNLNAGQISISASNLQYLEVGRAYHFQLCREQTNTTFAQPVHSTGLIKLLSCSPAQKVLVIN